MRVYKRIEAALESLKNSTRLTIEMKGETYIFDGRNSPYVSHKSCTIGPGHEIPHCVVFRNNSTVLVARYNGYLKHYGDFEERPLPKHLLRGLFQFPATVPDWLNDPGGAYVAIESTFRGYDSAGKPMFSWFGDWAMVYEDIIKIVMDREADILIPDELSWDKNLGLLLHGHPMVEGVEYQLPRYTDADELMATTDAFLAEHGWKIDVSCPEECPQQGTCVGCPHRETGRLVRLTE
mgnify:CR=1 FL=1